MARKRPEKIQPGSTEEVELVAEMQTLCELPDEQKQEPKQTAPKPDKINALVKCCFIETSDGINAKKGDTIEIPTDPKNHSPALELAIKTGNVVVDLAPVVSEDAE